MSKTLLELAGADLQPAKLKDASLVLIDIQNEYLEGPIAVAGAEQAAANAALLLHVAREHQSPVFHIAHKGRPGGLFDRDGSRGQIISAVDPRPGETIVEKQLPNAFAGTRLALQLEAAAKKDIVVCGFMTHMCVSSTVRAALDLGYRTTVAASAHRAAVRFNKLECLPKT